MYSLEGDGVCEHLYEFVWCKDELSFRPNVNIPDTIVYKFGQPVDWYFTGIDGKVKKKLKTNVINAKIEETFLKASLGADVLAYYVSWSGDASKYQDGRGQTTSIEYLDRQDLRDFLYNRWKERNGILQRFVEPKGTRNAMVRAIWSPKMCLLERRVNSRQLQDRRYGMYERAVTYDGPDIYSKAAPLRGSVLPSQVQKCCESIVAHVAQVSFKKAKIGRMSVNFKIDSRDRVWFLWSNSIRLASERSRGPSTHTHVDSPVNIGELVRVPPHVYLQQRPAHCCDEIKTQAQVRCTSCGEISSGNVFHGVHYKTIIAHFEQVVDLAASHSKHAGVVEWPPSSEILRAAGGVGFGGVDDDSPTDPSSIATEDVTIPPVIRKLHPKLAAEGYARHRRDPLFLYKTAIVCESCFLVYAELASLAFRATGRQALTEHTMSTQFSATHRSYTLNRLKMSTNAWQPLIQQGDTKSLHHTKLGCTAHNEAPAIPEPIRRQQDVVAQQGGCSKKPLPPEGPAFSTRQEIIRQRENDFFRDLATETRKNNRQPLLHMVASQQKLVSIGASHHRSGPSTHGKGPGVRKRSPYERPQILVEYMGRTPAQSEKPVLVKTGREGPLVQSKKHCNGYVHGVKVSSSTTKHHNFLSKSLSDVHEQLQSATLNEIDDHRVAENDDEPVATENKEVDVLDEYQPLCTNA